MDPPTTEPGFIQATAENLPRVDKFTVACYFNSVSFLNPTTRNVKTLRYHDAHCSARNTVERTIGVLKSKWRAVLGHKVLHYDPDTVRKIIRVTCALQNIALTMEDYLPANPNEPINHGAGAPENVQQLPENAQAEFQDGRDVRAQVIATRFLRPPRNPRNV